MLRDVAEGLGRSAEFDGRSGRRAFWRLFAFAACLWAVAAAAAPATGAAEVLLVLLAAALAVPVAAAAVRRLHDTNAGAWALLWLALPVLGWAILTHRLLRRGDPGENRFGPSPRDDAALIVFT